MENNKQTIETDGRELVSVRLLNAPRELVFKVWTEPGHIVKWWGPDGFTNSIKEMAVKPGGVWRFTMHGPDNVDFPNKVVYEEVVVPERLVYTHSGDDGSDHRFHVTVTFEEEGNKTRLTMRMLFDNAAQLDKVVKEFGAIEGNRQTMDKLAAYLENVSK